MTPDDRRHRRFDWAVISVMVVFLLVAGIAVTAAVTALGAAGEAKRATARVEREGLERRDQTCRLFEGQHLADVNRLKHTYTYLAHLPPRERGTTLTVAVVRSLPEIEADARVDSAPPYCDEPGEKAERLWIKSHGKRGAPPIGLPEPDPVLPERRDFRHLLKPGR